MSHSTLGSLGLSICVTEKLDSVISHGFSCSEKSRNLGCRPGEEGRGGVDGGQVSLLLPLGSLCAPGIVPLGSEALGLASAFSEGQFPGCPASAGLLSPLE